MSVATVSLGDLVAPAPLIRAEDQGELPVLSMTSAFGLVRQDQFFKKSIASRDISKYKRVSPGQIVVGIHVDEGAIGVSGPKDYGVVSPAYTLWDIRESGVHHGYLDRYIRSPRANQYFVAHYRQTAHRRGKLTRDKFLALDVPLPNFEEQRRIAAVLDAADALRAKRLQAIAKLDSLTQAIFIDMFGDPRRPQCTSQEVQLGSIVELFSGSTLPEGEDFDGQSGGYALVKVSDLARPGNRKFLLSTREWTSEPGPAASTCPPGSVVIPKRGGAIATNRKRVTTRDSILDPNLMAIAPNPNDLHLEYLYGWFDLLDLVTIQSGSSVPQLNKKDLVPLGIELPAIERQIGFARVVEQLGGRMSSMSQQLDQLDHLFASSQQWAFRGDL